MSREILLLVDALAPVLTSGLGRIHGAAQGLHLCLRLPDHADDRAIAAQAAREGLTEIRGASLPRLLFGHGLGAHRLMGCGVFVPHKSAAAVGE